MNHLRTKLTRIPAASACRGACGRALADGDFRSAAPDMVELLAAISSGSRLNEKGFRGIRARRSPQTQNVCLAVAILTIAFITNSTMACMACYRLPYRSMLEKVEACEQVIVARAINETRADWQGKVIRVIKGKDMDADQIVTVNKLKSDGITLGEWQLLRSSTFDGSWTILGSIDRESLNFLAGAVEASSHRSEQPSVRDQSQSLRYFLPYLEHANSQIADSTYVKLASAPYEVIRELRAHFEPEKLLAWIDDPQIAQKRGSLYITLLGICGGEREAALLNGWIKEGWKTQTFDNLAAMLIAQAELHGEETIRFIEKSYIQNRDRKLGEILAAVEALRVHGQANERISRARIQASYQLLLRERPQLAELIIEDCARWEDWSIAAKLMEIHAGGQQAWNNAMIIKYLEACPLPEAKHYLQQQS